MKVTIKFPLPEEGKYSEIIAEGEPEDVAEFLRRWLLAMEVK